MSALHDVIRQLDELAYGHVAGVRKRLEFARHTIHDREQFDEAMRAVKRELDDVDRLRVELVGASRHMDTTYRGLMDAALDLATTDPREVD